MTTHIIALIGAAGSGKTTVSKRLQGYSFARFRFAGKLKAMLRVFGLTEAQVDGDEKEIPAAILCGKTPRHAMQTLGTEWRDMIAPEMWTKALEYEINDHIRARMSLGLPAFIVIDDLRFPHEAEMIRRIGGEVWCIRRASVEPNVVQVWVSRLPWVLKKLATFVLGIKPLHQSELHWIEMEPDRTIFNNGTEADLLATVEAAITHERTDSEQLHLL